MTAQSVARRYAAALFDVVKKNGTIDAADAGLSSFAALVAESQEAAHAFASPAVPAQRKRALAEALAKQLGAPAEIVRLLGVMGDRDRLGLIAAVASAFDARVKEERHILQADVTTAVPLTDDRAAALAGALGRATGGTITINRQVDPAIVGGVVARVGSVVYDGSVSRQLELMKTQLLNAQNK